MAWDYIVVGAGSAGCVLAHRLSARPGNKVLLLEGGGSDTSPYLRVPAGEIKSILNPRFNWMYMSEPDPSLNGRDAMWPGGKVLGGSSSINGMIYLRGQREDYDDWGRLAGNTGAWSYRDVLPYFKRMESNPLGASEYHGDSGPLLVSDVPTPHPLVRVFIEGAQEIGIPFNADVNGATQEGAGPNQGTIRFGHRNSTARAYLRPVMDRANLRVETEARVDRVLFEEGRARTVVYSRGGERREATADGEIILSAGAIASPAIPLRSGIGPGADLAALGIPVVADSPGVGNNLQEHPVAWVAGHVDISTYNTEVTVSGYVRHGLNWLLRGKGPAASPIAQAVAFVRTRPEEEERPDIQHRLQLLPLLFRRERQRRTGVLFRSVPLHQLHQVARDRQAAPLCVAANGFPIRVRRRDRDVLAHLPAAPHPSHGARSRAITEIALSRLRPLPPGSSHRRARTNACTSRTPSRCSTCSSSVSTRG